MRKSRNSAHGDSFSWRCSWWPPHPPPRRASAKHWEGQTSHIIQAAAFSRVQPTRLGAVCKHLQPGIYYTLDRCFGNALTSKSVSCPRMLCRWRLSFDAFLFSHFRPHVSPVVHRSSLYCYCAVFWSFIFFSFFPKQLRVQTRYVFSFLSVITSIETKLEETTKQTGNGNIRTYSCLMCEKR